MTAFIDDQWQIILEKDDRTSPADYPDMCLITKDEFAAPIKVMQLRAEKAERERDATRKEIAEQREYWAAQFVRWRKERDELRERAERVARLSAALRSAQHLIRNLGGQHGDLLDQIDDALRQKAS